MKTNQPQTHQQKQTQQDKRTFRQRLKHRGKLRLRKKVPELLQMSDAECGIACLAMILSYYGRRTSISELREQGAIGRDGLSAQDIVKMARKYGLRVRAVSLPQADFRHINLPAIIHWEFDHFLVLERWSSRRVKVVDPAFGHRNMSAEEFDAGFTGVVLLLEPDTHFTSHNPAPRVGLRTYITTFVKRAPWSLIQVMLASLLLQLFGLGVPLLTKLVVDGILPAQKLTIMTIVGIGILVLASAQFVVMLLRSLLLTSVQARVDMTLIPGFVEHLLALPLRFFQQRSTGDILTRLSSNTTVRETLSNQLISTILDGGFVIVYLIILFWQSSIFGLLALLIGSLQIVLLLVSRGRLLELATGELAAQGKAQGYAAELLSGIVTLKAAGAEQRAFQHWSNLFLSELNISVRRNIFSSFIESTMGLLHTLSPLILLWIGALLVLNGSMQIGTMLALNALAITFLTPLSSLVSSMQSLQLIRSHLERISDVMEAEPEQQTQSVHLPPRLTGEVRLDHVCFHYDAQAQKVLKDITLQIEAGQKIAIVGRTGSGKSTLGKLLLGLHLPTQGEILYDGIPLRFFNYQAVRSQFGVVMQDATLFSGSIRQNIAFNDPAMQMERVIQSAQAAVLHDDIMQMPMGYETMISEGGSVLSGGQRQRLAIARALAHKPALILLDEATSSLDVLTEQALERNLDSLTCTRVIIAHRLSTIRNADCIVVLDEGSIIETGTHDELLQRNAYYAQLIQSQLAGEEVSLHRNL
jgi:ATP-binding cassette subfamily B protein